MWLSTAAPDIVTPYLSSWNDYQLCNMWVDAGKSCGTFCGDKGMFQDGVRNAITRVLIARNEPTSTCLPYQQAQQMKDLEDRVKAAEAEAAAARTRADFQPYNPK